MTLLIIVSVLNLIFVTALLLLFLSFFLKSRKEPEYKIPQGLFMQAKKAANSSKKSKPIAYSEEELFYKEIQENRRKPPL